MKTYKKKNIALSKQININNFKLSSIWYRFYGEKDYRLLKNKDISIDWIHTNIIDENPKGNKHVFYTLLNDNTFYKTQEAVIGANIKYGGLDLSGYVYFVDKEPTGVYVFCKRNRICFFITEDEKDEANIEGFYILNILTGIEDTCLDFALVKNVRFKLLTQQHIKITTSEKKYKSLKYNYLNLNRN